MRTHLLIAVLTTAAACGDDGGENRPPPRVLAGGGIGDGAIAGVVNLYVIDDLSRTPIAGAEVRVGDVAGTTDADGLFVAEGLTGPQTIVATAPGYPALMWTGANGANMTMNLGRPTKPIPRTGTITCTVDLTGVTVATGHLKAAIVSYLQTDTLGDPENEIQQPAKANLCGVAAGALVQTCTFSVQSRVGDVALLALIVDVDPGLDPGPADDVTTFVQWGYKGGITVAQNQAIDVTLDVLPTTANSDLTIDFGTPPANLTSTLGLVGVETAGGVFQLPFVANATTLTVAAPMPTAVGGTGYRLTAVAADLATPPTQSIVIRRGQPTTTLAAGTWITPPTNVALTRTNASWTPTAGATAHSIEYSVSQISVATVTLFDNASAVELPDLITLPAGPIDAKIQAIGAPGLDVTDFELDRDRALLVTVGATPASVAN
ncbi:MAG: carboxypeptidase-like regulatory domain-containing protein [Proteobacteria bacterium]|nr:carboxypeptidase-like regulatory domain-containing protein [Pseudomonadota bacterium]